MSGQIDSSNNIIFDKVQQLTQIVQNQQDQQFYINENVMNNVSVINKSLLSVRTNVSNLQNTIINLDQNFTLIATALDRRIFNNFTILTDLIQQSKVAIENSFLSTVKILDQRLWDNVSLLKESLFHMNTTIDNVISNITNQKDELQQIEQSIYEIENSLTNFGQNIFDITEIEKYIVSNYSKSDINLLANTSSLDIRIYDNISSVKTDILTKYIIADQNLLLNTTILDWRIFNNVSKLETSIQNLTYQLNNMYNSSQLYLMNQTMNDINYSLNIFNKLIDQQQNAINNLTEQFNCISNYGYSVLNGTCVQVKCTIVGQQIINGICQCINKNSIISGGSCTCPTNSSVVGNVCTCFISGQIIQNNVCACSTTGALVINNVCSCGINSLNISNACICPSGANLVNGVCTCGHINAYIIGSQCVCPNYTILIGNVCQCPYNSQIINNTCICNQIIGQVMKNGVCVCQTTNAYANNGACACGIDALNVSNECICPVFSTFINNSCICDKIVGQKMINGQCQCQSGYLVINESCQQSSYVISNYEFICSQEVYTTLFDILSISYYISISSYLNGYVFGSSNIIQNVFIDVSDNIYTTTVQPLFQSQIIYTNIKIQYGTQILSSGSLILQSCIQITINQVNIISRSGSQLTVNSASQLNIITYSSKNANINNLLVNLSFSNSSGNITLINNINNIFAISGYQVLGTYVSTQNVALIGNNINVATVTASLINIQPNIFKVGNGSSYLFGCAITTQSDFTINNISIILGNSSYFNIMGSIISTDKNSYFFGGLIAYINSASNFNVNNIIIDSYQQFSTNYVSNFGFLLGYVQSGESFVSITNICIQQNMSSTTLQFNQTGLIGENYGTTTIKNAQITFQVQGVYFCNFGIIGRQFSNSLNAEVINVKTSVNVISSSGNSFGSIFGANRALNSSIINTSVQGGDISADTKWIGGFIGYQWYNVTITNSTIAQTNISGQSNIGGFIGNLISNANTTIVNSTIARSNISGSDYIAGLIGYCMSTVYVMNSKIQFIRLSGSSSRFGIVIGNNGGNQTILGSSSTQNYIFNILQNDCTVLSSSWQAVGC
ncbi:Conserved_hypothetical protein [Hexamita inflata]|uniref:Uncharacterized protein n=1 Tax=Hexamita inflata TaxID=28002 RepID=A0AA86U804_9EUKA|nr:Conserved hypothetical protein [Hexamita inflata]